MHLLGFDRMGWMDILKKRKWQGTLSSKKKNMLERLKLRKNKNKYDNFDYNFYNKVQKGFLKIANKNKSKYLILDTNKDNLKIIENKLINKIEKIIK